MTQRLMARVKGFREARGLSQESFAERAGLKYKHYQAVEAGRKGDFRFSTLIKLAKACESEPWELLNFDAPLAAAERTSKDSPEATSRKALRKLPKRRSGPKSS